MYKKKGRSNIIRRRKNQLLPKVCLLTKIITTFNASRVTGLSPNLAAPLSKHHQHRPWRRYSLPFRSRQSISPAPSQLLCTSSPTLSRFLPAPPLRRPPTTPSTDARRANATRQGHRDHIRFSAAIFTLVSRYFSLLHGHLQHDTRERKKVAYARGVFFARKRALIANDCFRRVPPFREKVTGEVRATRVPNPDG